MTEEPLVLVFIPTLVSILWRAETDKGSPLTEREVIAIRDGATCITVPYSVAEASEEQRGYPDIVGEDCWSEWQRARIELSSAD
jgi:hypothetical protein